MDVVLYLKKTHDEAYKNPTEIKVDTERYLTKGEIEMAKLIFKDSIDYSKVKIIREGFGGIPTRTRNAMTPVGNIHLPSDEYVKNKDFSTAKSGTDRHWLIHEMTHVWQYQMGFNTVAHALKEVCLGGYWRTTQTDDTPEEGDLLAYATDIKGKDINKEFNQFNFEQQGRIIEFWFDACYLQSVQPNRPHHQKSLKLLGYVERILQDFLHDPKNTKLLPMS